MTAGKPCAGDPRVAGGVRRVLGHVFATRLNRRVAVSALVALALLGATATAAWAAAPDPDQRVLEMVTPLEKNQGDASTGSVLDRDHIYFNTFGAFLPNDLWVTIGGHYLATRTDAGWTLKPGFQAPNTAIADFSADYSQEVIIGVSPLLPEDGDLATDVYLRTGTDLRLISTGPLGGDADEAAFFAGQSKDGARVLFETAEHLAAEDPAADPGARTSGKQLYEHVNGQTSVVGVLPDDECAGFGLPVGCVGPGGAVLGDGTQQSQRPSGSFNAITPDGSHVFFESPDPTVGPSELYVRMNGTSTRVSASHCDRMAPAPPCSGPSAVTFQGASVDGSKVFFTTDAQLVDDDVDATTDLYRYDVGSGQLARLTNVEGAFNCGAANVGVCGVTAVSDDGGRVYFQAAGTAAPGGAIDGMSLYLYDGESDDVTFVAPIGLSDINFEHGLYSANANANATPDGRTLIFQSNARVTAFDSAGSSEVYRYDADSDELSCLSCNSAGTPPLHSTLGISGDIRDSFVVNPFGSPSGPGQGSRLGTVVSDDGQTVVFKSIDALVPEDTNARFDIYEWHNGDLFLLTSGIGVFDASLSGISGDGHDIFFTTYDQLLPQDTDFHADVYDARIDGDSRIPPPTPSECREDACQGKPAARPGITAGGSATYEGRGNSVRTPSSKGRMSIVKPKSIVGSTAKLRIKVSGAGRVSIGGRLIHARTRALPRAGTYSIAMTLSPGARKALRHRGAVRARIKVTFKPKAGRATAKTITLVFRR